jgi:DNA-binding HxlR family transcriptional regulator
MAEQQLKCYVSHASEFFSEPWSMLILREFMIFGGTRRFEQLYNALGISRNVLTKRLRRFVELGLIKKSPIFENSRRMEYKLRRKAWELSPVMLALHVWAERWADDGYVSELDFVDNITNLPLAKGAVRSQDGRVLEPGEINVIAKTDNARHYFKKYATKAAKGDSGQNADLDAMDIAKPENDSAKEEEAA